MVWVLGEIGKVEGYVLLRFRELGFKEAVFIFRYRRGRGICGGV